MNDKAHAGVELPIDIERIAALLPHRYPFLLIDRVIAFEPKKLVALKNVSGNEQSSRAISRAIPSCPAS